MSLSLKPPSPLLPKALPREKATGVSNAETCWLLLPKVSTKSSRRWRGTLKFIRIGEVLQQTFTTIPHHKTGAIICAAKMTALPIWALTEEDLGWQAPIIRPCGWGLRFAKLHFITPLGGTVVIWRTRKTMFHENAAMGGSNRGGSNYWLAGLLSTGSHFTNYLMANDIICSNLKLSARNVISAVDINFGSTRLYLQAHWIAESCNCLQSSKKENINHVFEHHLNHTLTTRSQPVVNIKKNTKAKLGYPSW